MAFDQAAVNALIDAAVSHAMSTGAFRTVNRHEPKAAPGKGLTASVWAQDIRPTTSSGLAATSGIVTLNLRVYGNMLQKPEDETDPRLIAAVSMLMDQYTGDFTFGGTIRHIDLLGAYGAALSAQAGYLTMAGNMYRIMTLTIPCVINDMWVQGGIPSAEETPGRSLQVDSLGVTGGANIGGALTVAADATVGGALGVGIAPTHIFDVNSSASGGLAQFTRTSTSDTTPVVLVLAGDTSTASALALSVNGDANSRFAVAPAGAIGWGTGTSVRDAFLSRTAAGQLTVTGNTTTTSEIKSLVVGDGTAGARSLSITSSYNGGNDDGTAGHYDSTGRIYLTSYQRAGTNGYGESVRYAMQRWDAKAMHAWQFPQTYDGSGNPVGSLTSKVWMGAHYEGTTDAPTDVHGHWSMEVPDAGHEGAQGFDALRTRFSINFCDVNAILNGTADILGPGMGIDKTLIATNQADFLVRLGYTTFGIGDGTGRAASALRIKNDAGLNSDMEWGRADDSSNRRWVIRGMSADAETGSNAGAAFQVIGYGDTGTILGTALQLTRATGQVTIGVTSTYQGGLVVNRSAGNAVKAVNSATGGTSFYANTADTTSRVLSGDVVGDANQRFVIYTTGQQEWGTGSTTRDTNLYRNAAGVLRTDTAFYVGTNLGVGTGPNSSTQRLTVLSGSSSGQLAQFKRTTASDGTPVVTIEAADTSSAQSLGFLVTGDTTNRCGIDANGKHTWGSGSVARDVNLYRSAAGVLKTDNSLAVGAGFGIGATPPAAGASVVGTASSQLVYIEQDGSAGHGLTVNLAGTGGASQSAINAVSANSSFSCLEVTGVETNRGTVKIAHKGYSDGSDASAAAVSIDLQTTSGGATGTAAQGLFVTSTTDAIPGGNAITVRYNSQDWFVVKGNVGTGSGIVGIGVATSHVPAAMLEIAQKDTTTPGLFMQALSGGTDLVQLKNSGGSLVLQVNNSGNLVARANAFFTSPVVIGATSSDAGGSGSGLTLCHTTDPSANPAAGHVILYVDASGNLMARTSAGNVRTIAAV